MNLPLHVQEIEVFYDGRCGMCCTFHEWVNQQRRAFAVRFISYQSEEAARVFPDLESLDPAREMVVRTWEGDVFGGAEAWIWCLYSCVGYRKVAQHLCGPVMLPMAVKVCRLISESRQGLSQLFFRKKNREVLEVLEVLHEIRMDDEQGKGECFSGHE